MDSFKVGEVKRMEMGGNAAWKEFWQSQNPGKTYEDCGVEQRYTGDEAEEWKERLSAKIEGREYVPVPKAQKSVPVLGAKKPISRTTTPLQGTSTRGNSRSPSRQPQPSQKQLNESYFARLGNANASRPADLAPSQGGKYAGFGSSPEPTTNLTSSTPALPGLDNLAQDPLGTLTKGFGWLSAAVGKSAKDLNEGWIQPTAKRVAESDVAAQARGVAGQVVVGVSKGGQGAMEGLNRFIEGDEGTGRPGARGVKRNVEPERKDFWDSFGGGDSGAFGGKGLTGKTAAAPSTIGTAAMKSGGAKAGGKGGQDDEWEEW